MTRINSFNLKYIKASGEDKQEIIIIEIMIIREITKMGIDKQVEIKGHHTEVEVSMDKIIQEDFRRDSFRHTQNYRD